MKTLLVTFALLVLSAPAWAGSSAEVTVYDTDVSVCEGMDPTCMARVKLLLVFAPDSMTLGSGQAYFRTALWTRKSSDDGHRNPLVIDLGAGFDWTATPGFTMGLLMSSKHCVDRPCGVESYNAFILRWAD